MGFNSGFKGLITTLLHVGRREGNDGSPLSALGICADFVQVQSRGKSRDHSDRLLQHYEQLGTTYVVDVYYKY